MGSVGAVFAGQFEGQQVAIKAMGQLKRREEMIEKEILFHSCLDHPHVLRFIKTAHDDHLVVIVTELAPHGDLFEYLRVRRFFSEKQTCDLMEQLLNALAYCHSQGIIHRDVKLENVLVFPAPTENAPPVLKLGDFGFATDEPLCDEIAGTIDSWAPEQAKCEEYFNAVDVWALGVCMYWMLMGHPPHCGLSQPEIIVRLRTKARPINDLPDQFMSESCQDLYRHLTSVDSFERPTCVRALNHPWFSMKRSL